MNIQEKKTQSLFHKPVQTSIALSIAYALSMAISLKGEEGSAEAGRYNTFFLKKDKPLQGLRGRGAEPHTVLRKDENRNMENTHEKTLYNRKKNFMLLVLPKSEGGDEEIKYRR